MGLEEFSQKWKVSILGAGWDWKWVNEEEEKTRNERKI